jgi:hypothetical protein
VVLEEGPPGPVVGHEARAVLVAGDLLEDHLLLGGEVLLPQSGEHEPGEEGKKGRGELGQDRPVVDRGLLRGEGVVLGPHAVKGQVDGKGVHALGALEDHVLQEVAHPALMGGLVPGPGLHEVPQGHAPGLGEDLGDDPEAVF